MKFEFSLKPLKPTEKPGWYDVPVITVEAENFEEAKTKALALVPNGFDIWAIIEFSACSSVG